MVWIFFYATSIGLVCFLMKNGKFVAYSSKKLKIYEKNYRTHDLEQEQIFCLNELEKLFIWCSCECLYQPREFKICA